MGQFTSLAGFAAATLALSVASQAMAQQRLVDTVVTALSDRITYSREATTSPPRPALITYVPYLVEITNKGTNTLNNVRFEGASSVADLQESAPFSSSQGAVCVERSAPTQISCTVGQLRAGRTASFVVFFKSPIQDFSNIEPEGFVDKVSFSGTTWFAEGTTDSSTSPENSSSTSNIASIPLGTTSAVRIKTAVQKGGGAFFTGTSGAPDPVDTFATRLSIPALPTGNYAIAEITEKKPTDGDPDYKCPDSVSCLDIVNVSVRNKDEGGTPLTFSASPGTDPLSQYLVITLRRDKSQFTGNIGRVVVYYDGVSIMPCANNADPIPVGQARCVYDRRVLKKNDPEVRANPDLEGDAQITILAKENGFYAW